MVIELGAAIWASSVSFLKGKWRTRNCVNWNTSSSRGIGLESKIAATLSVVYQRVGASSRAWTVSFLRRIWWAHKSLSRNAQSSIGIRFKSVVAAAEIVVHVGGRTAGVARGISSL